VAIIGVVSVSLGEAPGRTQAADLMTSKDAQGQDRLSRIEGWPKVAIRLAGYVLQGQNSVERDALPFRSQPRWYFLSPTTVRIRTRLGSPVLSRPAVATLDHSPPDESSVRRPHIAV
jgi:hypothetical protein